MTPIQFLPDDLSPGDQRFLPLDFSHLTAGRVSGAQDPLLQRGYDRLWQEFGAHHEMESKEVIESRLLWHPASLIQNRWFRYEMVVLTHGEDLVAVRDHVAIVSRSDRGPRAVVHLSHIVVEPEWRRSGVAAWMRAIPLQTARIALQAAGFPVDSPITLVAEMEHPDATHEARTIRLGAYERAGFLKVDPGSVEYHQPDFREPSEIDRTGGPRPLPFALLLRRVGRESERSLDSLELHEIVSSLYHMYGLGFRSQDMSGLWKEADRLAEVRKQVSLVLPTHPPEA